jgi:hypothetical protein
MPGKYAGTAWIVASALTENITTQHQPLLLGTALFGFEPVVPPAIWMAFPQLHRPVVSAPQQGRHGLRQGPHRRRGTPEAETASRDSSRGWLRCGVIQKRQHVCLGVKKRARRPRNELKTKGKPHAIVILSPPARGETAGLSSPRLLLGRNNRGEPLAPLLTSPSRFCKSSVQGKKRRKWEQLFAPNWRP